jgi:lantibiotic modifying enzyme
MNSLELKTQEIARVILSSIENEFAVDSGSEGLYSGSSGIILFLGHYLKKYPDKGLENIYDGYFHQYIERLTSQPQTFLTYCSGLMGVFTSLKLMNDSSLISLDFSEIEDAYDDKLWSWMNYSFTNQNYDFLHGALGVAMYFRDDPRYIKSTLLGLEKTAIEDNNKLKWISSLGQDRPMGYNICLSHGISSIIIYLSSVYQSGVITELNEQLLNGAVNYVLSQEIDYKKFGCFFPNQSLDNGDPIYKSRLAWCYGDLGVAAALWQAGKVTENCSWMNKALDVYRFSANRISPQDAMVNDAGICHGTAGIAMMFSYMYRQTGDPTLINTRNYWVDQTLKMSKFPDGLAGYKKFTLDDDKNVKWEESFSILEGIAGIGFMLLSVLDKEAENDLFKSFGLY